MVAGMNDKFDQRAIKYVPWILKMVDVYKNAALYNKVERTYRKWTKAAVWLVR